jgi:indole-3-glycerol phosphate synthase
MTPLVEVHTERDVQRALPLSPLLIGINNRNLHDFTVDLGVTRRLRPLIPPGSMVISESGISHAGQMQELAALGVDAVLIGEALVRAADPEALLRDLKAAGQ